jgi:hypothetical protein
MKQGDVLVDVAWGMHFFGAVCTGRGLPRRDMILARDAGLVESIGQVAMCDGDGFTIEPERYREGWVLTESGKMALREYDADAADRYLSNNAVRVK